MINKELEKAITNIYEASKTTQLYKDMIERGGKPVIHKGSETPETVFVGEAGGRDEDRVGEPFVGRAGKILDRWIAINHIKNYAVINVVPIMPEQKPRKNGKT